MATISIPDFPVDLYARLEALAKANNLSVEAQIIILLEQALATQTQDTEDERRKNVPKLLEENRRRREQLSTDIEWPDSTAMIRENRDK